MQAAAIAVALQSSAFSTVPSATLTWNQMAALPAVMTVSDLLTGAPYNFDNQQSAVIRNILLTTAARLAVVLLNLRQPVQSVVRQATLNQNDTLMGVASRSTGNFENWPAIAALNGILPPYPGPANTSLVGTNLLLPTTSVPAASGAPLPNYAINVLGTDYDYGPINSMQLFTTTPLNPAWTWTGDIPLMTGYKNYARALGRRLQTSVGTLVYHSSYGSRIPPEVGSVQGLDEAKRLAEFGRSALAADPRTGTILSAVATVQPGFLASFSGVVAPIGPGSTPVSVNETISPLP